MNVYSNTSTSEFSIIRSYFQKYYHELKAMAHKKLFSEKSNHTFDTSALVHEAYINLSQQQNLKFNNSQHFLAITSIVMRRIMIDYARQSKRQKRGGEMIKMTIGGVSVPVETTSDEILALNDALNLLKRFNKRQSRIVEYCFFGGFKHQEIADMLNVSLDTVRRDWRIAKAWLSSQLKHQLHQYES